MSLSQYKKKRNFKETPEPKAVSEKAPDKVKKKLMFTVQRHHASHLHYDFRLELNGTLKSWAVPKGPSLNPADKRLAMMVEDHPISYAMFEGDIPEGNYGAGHVDVWDHGTYEPVDENGELISVTAFSRALRAGSIKFRMKGKKLKGEFALVNMKKDDKSWLLLKHRDKYATDEAYNADDYAKKSSLAYSAERARKSKSVKKKVKPVLLEVQHFPKTSASKFIRGAGKQKLDRYIKPMLAKLHNEPFDGADWIFEIKWDGYRAIAEVDSGNVLLYSRNGLSFAEAYPAVYEALQLLKQKGLVLDGEIVALDENGVPSFQLLQQYEPGGNVPLCYYVFDCLKVRGRSIEDKPLLERKRILKELLPDSNIIRYSDHISKQGRDFFSVVEKKGLEGMMAKQVSSNYQEGVRTGAWLKIKHILTEEAVIVGFTKPRGSRKFFGALVLGVYQDKKLSYIGHTGTGFNDATLRELYSQLKELSTDKNPFGEEVPVNMPVTWVKPVLVCNIKYTEVTKGGSRRHPVFMGLRVDKAAQEVTENILVDKVLNEPLKLATMKKATSKRQVSKKQQKADSPFKDIAVNDEPQKIDKMVLSFSNTEKLFWPEGYTKGDVINYYNAVYTHIAPYLKDRPESLLRTPNGIMSPGFFHKDVGNKAPDWVDTYKIYSESAQKDINYIVCNNRATLLYMANLGCIEINPWCSRIKKPQHPDYLVLDIDPSEKNTFEQVIETANVIHEILDRAGAASFPKTSGASGMHIYVPLGAKYTYEQAKDFAHLVATLAQAQLPDFTSLERSLSKRGKSKIYIDYLQNRIGQTLAAPYSLRPKTGATVSTPLEWHEVVPGLMPSHFTIENILARIKTKGDLFAGVLKKGIDMRKCIRNLEK